MGVIALVIVANEVEELELTAGFRIDTPIEKCAERIALHEAVKKPAYLLRPPYELALDGRQHQVVSMYFVEGLLDGFTSPEQRDPPRLLDYMFSPMARSVVFTGLDRSLHLIIAGQLPYPPL